MCVRMRVCIYIWVGVDDYVCAHVCMSVDIYIWVYIDVDVCVRVYIYGCV